MRLGVDTERLGEPRYSSCAFPGSGEDHLKLRVALHPVGIVTVAGVIGADGGLRIAHAPGLGAERTEEGGGVHGPRADLGVVRQPEGAAAVGPVLLEPESPPGRLGRSRKRRIPSRRTRRARSPAHPWRWRAPPEQHDGRMRCEEPRRSKPAYASLKRRRLRVRTTTSPPGATWPCPGTPQPYPGRGARRGRRGRSNAPTQRSHAAYCPVQSPG